MIINYHIMWRNHVMELDDWLRGDRWLVRRVHHIRRSISTQDFAAFWLSIRCRNAPHTSGIHQIITITMKNSWFWRFVPLALRKCTRSVRRASGIWHEGSWHSWFSTRSVLLQVLVVESRSQSNDAFASTGIAHESSQPRSHSSSDGGPSDSRPENSE